MTPIPCWVASRGEPDFSGVRPVDAPQDFHQRRFAGAVLSDEPDDFSWPDIQRYGIQSHNAGKTFGYSGCLKQWNVVQLRPRSTLIFFVNSSTFALFTINVGMMICLFAGMNDRSPLSACAIRLIA
jgi:hypothetical protein